MPSEARDRRCLSTCIRVRTRWPVLSFAAASYTARLCRSLILPKTQQAAAIFKHAKLSSEAWFGGSPPSADLEPALLDALSKTMLAQAQETICYKAINDKMKSALVAKLCNACATMYQEVTSLFIYFWGELNFCLRLQNVCRR